MVLPLAESADMPAGRIFLVEDVTDVMRSNRLAAWAEMARRIAHEIKNPLTPIQLSAEHLLRVRSNRDPNFDRVLQECVETILGQVRALREISSDFSTYSRLPDLRREPSDLAALVRSTLAPYRSSPPDGLRVSEKIDAVPPASLDTRVLRRALVNLIENALQAMEHGGLLTVTLHLRGEGAGSFAEIVVADTGGGMDEATRAKIFEPYFSTRDAGIGLGLAIARRAVEEHGGTLTAESEPGRGTRMIIRLPLVTDPTGPRPPMSATTGVGGGESG
jgi:nitrogen fixation/metabolism regulation signal transduction histidine kinase